MRAATIAFLSVGFMAAICGGQAVAQDTSPRACFYGRDMAGWKAPDPHTMYVSVNPNKVYRLTFNQPCASLMYMDVHLITKFHGSDSVCSPIDWDLQVSDLHGSREACIVSSMTPMTPAEIAAIPSKYRP